MVANPSARWPARWAAGRQRGYRFLPCMWLAFLVLPLASMLDRPDTGAVHATVVIVVALGFGALFAWITSRRSTDGGAGPWVRRREWLAAPVLLAIPIFLAGYDASGWIYCFVYALFPLMRLWRQEHRWRAVLAVMVIDVATGLATGAQAGDLIAAQCVLLGTGGSWLGFGRLMEANAVLSEAQEDRTQAAVADERLRFARDLHDLLGHSLSVVALKSEVAGRLVDVDPDRARAEIREIEQVARQALREVREAVTGYRRATVAVELVSARSALAASGVTWTESVDDGLDLPAEVEAVLAWALREGVTNVLRHSAARAVAISVASVDGEAVAAVTDDGVGASGAGAGAGLAGLGERAALVGGSVAWGAGAGGTGVCLRVRVPAPSSAPARTPAPAPVPAPVPAPAPLP